MFRRSADPYLKNYVVAAVVFVASTWLALRFSQGEAQVDAALVVFGLTAMVALGVVGLRGIEAHAYATNGAKPLPVGFEHEPRMTPYWILLGSVALAAFLMVFLYTATPENQGNLKPLLVALLLLATWLMACRLAWQYVDNRIKEAQSRRIQQDPEARQAAQAVQAPDAENRAT